MKFLKSPSKSDVILKSIDFKIRERKRTYLKISQIFSITPLRLCVSVWETNEKHILYNAVINLRHSIKKMLKFYPEE